MLNQIRAFGVSLLMGTAALATVFAFLPTEVAANNGNGNGNGNSGGNGNGNSGGNGNGNSGGNGNGNGNGNGAIASELKGLNAAHANANAFANASPNSMPGKLNLYSEAVGAVGVAEDALAAANDSLAQAQADLDAAQAELTRLNGLTPEEIDAEFTLTQEEIDAGVTAQSKYDAAVAEATN